MLFNTAPRPPNRIVFANDIAEVWRDDITGHHSLYAVTDSKEGEVFCRFEASAILQTPSSLTIQVSEYDHICLNPDFLRYTNHSCCPNIFFDTTAYEIVCLRDIKPGDELTYFYPSTEWEMAQPFQCLCGCKNCLGYIGGASYLSQEVLSGYRLSDFIRQQVNKKYIK
jgi:hypothetical protein